MIPNAVTEFSDTERRQEVAVTRQHTEVAFGPGRDDFIHLLTQQLLLRCDHL
jgi:hypothetical protein